MPANSNLDPGPATLEPLLQQAMWNGILGVKAAKVPGEAGFDEPAYFKFIWAFLEASARYSKVPGRLPIDIVRVYDSRSKHFADYSVSAYVFNQERAKLEAIPPSERLNDHSASAPVAHAPSRSAEAYTSGTDLRVGGLLNERSAI